MNDYKFCLYVVGGTPNSAKNIRNLKEILETRAEGRYSLECVDVLCCLEEAVERSVFATPMLERVLPLPVKRVVGSFNTEKDTRAAVCLLM